MDRERVDQANAVPLFLGYSFSTHWLPPYQGSATHGLRSRHFRLSSHSPAVGSFQKTSPQAAKIATDRGTSVRQRSEKPKQCRR